MNWVQLHRLMHDIESVTGRLKFAARDLSTLDLAKYDKERIKTLHVLRRLLLDLDDVVPYVAVELNEHLYPEKPEEEVTTS